MTGELLGSFGRLARHFRADESGATAIEYALIAAGIAAAIIVTVTNLGSTIKTALWDKVGNAM
ncbi:MAG: Flp family type IVb pilin [Alphaproteobacteria bacterium]|nr:MAG: Flp family type IVb pilin [Alphaproteobacteria bacterium]